MSQKTEPAPVGVQLRLVAVVMAPLAMVGAALVAVREAR
jgi:hypothetical protein